MKSIFFTLGLGLGVGLTFLDPVQAQTQTQTTQYYLNIHQFGQLGEIPGTTTLEHATVVPIGTGTATAETTYLYLNAQTTETLIVSASGYEEIAGSHPRECHYTAPDGGICEFARLESGVTVEMTSTMGKPWGIAIPVSAGVTISEATQADGNGIGVGVGRNDNGAVGMGSPLLLGLVLGSIIGGAAPFVLFRQSWGSCSLDKHRNRAVVSSSHPQLLPEYQNALRCFEVQDVQTPQNWRLKKNPRFCPNHQTGHPRVVSGTPVGR